MHAEPLNFSWRLGLPDEETSAIFVEGKRLAEQRADRRELAMLMNRYGTVQRMAASCSRRSTAVPRPIASARASATTTC